MTQPCPRSLENWHGVKTSPRWRPDGTCSYCGSLHNDTLMDRLRQATVEVGPTDKSYKIYVRNAGGESFHQSYKTSEGDWITRSVEETKFYFQHMTDEQMREFVWMMNSGLISMGHLGRLYTLPFFVGERS